MKQELYKFGPNGSERIDVPANHDKNNLPIGTVLELNGCGNPRYVIVKNLGISESSPGYGTQYLKVKLDDYTFSRSDAFAINHIGEKKDRLTGAIVGRI